MSITNLNQTKFTHKTSHFAYIFSIPNSIVPKSPQMTSSASSIVLERSRNFEKLQDHLSSNWQSNGQMPSLRSRANKHVAIAALKQQQPTLPIAAKRTVLEPVPVLRSRLRNNEPVQIEPEPKRGAMAPPAIKRRTLSISDSPSNDQRSRSVRELTKMYEHC